MFYNSTTNSTINIKLSEYLVLEIWLNTQIEYWVVSRPEAAFSFLQIQNIKCIIGIKVLGKWKKSIWSINGSIINLFELDLFLFAIPTKWFQWLHPVEPPMDPFLIFHFIGSTPLKGVYLNHLCGNRLVLIHSLGDIVGQLQISHVIAVFDP